MARAKHFIDSIYYDLELTANLLKKMGEQLFEQWEVGVSPLEHAALDTIFCHTGICQRDLAKLLLKDRANTGRVLDTLEAKGLITRFIDMKNNRLVRKMGVTEKGHEKLEEVSRKIESHFQKIRATATDAEVDQLQVSLRKFRENILEVVNVNI